MSARQSNSHRIRCVLEQRILDGTLAPGARLRELEIAKEFQTSQTPVREALEALHTMRLVESERYRGTYVRAITDREMEEAYAVRGALEQLAAELAAPHLKGNVSDLREILASLKEAAMAGDKQQYSKFNDQFHRSIVAHSRNTLLMESWAALGFETRVRVHLAQRSQPHLEGRADEHTPIVDALEDGDGVLAGWHLREHARACLLRWKQRHLPGQEPESPIDLGESLPATFLS